MKKLLLLLIPLCLLGCTTSGPFVTNISNDGQGGLKIEKAKVIYNMLFGVIGTKHRTVENIKLN